MKAAIVTDSGLAIADIQRPSRPRTRCWVRVHAAGLNRAELSMAAGHRHGALGGAGAVIGLEWAGEVVEVGHDVRGVAPGAARDVLRLRRLCGIRRHRLGARLPHSRREHEFRASRHPADRAADDARRDRHQRRVFARTVRADPGGQLRRRHRGAAGRTRTGAPRKSSARRANAAWRARLAEFGCDQAIDTGEAAWPQTVLEATGGHGVDLVVDMVSASVANGNLAATKILGKIVNVGRLGGSSGEFDFDLHAMRGISYVGSPSAPAR